MMPRMRRGEWDALPPKRCPACERVLPRAACYTSGGKCKPCYIAHRSAARAKKTVATAGPRAAGRDFMPEPQGRLLPRRSYTALTPAECAAVRRLALELLTATDAREAAA